MLWHAPLSPQHTPSRELTSVLTTQVRWPSGLVSTAVVAAGERLVISEPETAGVADGQADLATGRRIWGRPDAARPRGPRTQRPLQPSPSAV